MYPVHFTGFKLTQNVDLFILIRLKNLNISLSPYKSLLPIKARGLTRLTQLVTPDCIRGFTVCNVCVCSGVFGLKIWVGQENLMQSVSSERSDHSTFDHKIAAEKCKSPHSLNLTTYIIISIAPPHPHMYRA